MVEFGMMCFLILAGVGGVIYATSFLLSALR